MTEELQFETTEVPIPITKDKGRNNIFQLIRQKKAELSKQLQDLQLRQICLPHIQNQPLPTESYKYGAHHAFQRSDRNEQKRIGQHPTPARNYNRRFNTILDQFQQVKGKGQACILLKPKAKAKSMKITQKSTRMDQSRMKKLKTQSKSRKFSLVQSSHPSSIQKLKISDVEESHRFEQSVTKFRQYVEYVPKNMKLRNEVNLTQTIAQLQKFNPFFNRNPNIINICLLKIGKIIFNDSANLLYKAGQILEHFYIILLGKVKLVEGSFRRVCQTGETILQEVLFNEKSKKASLERAKTVSSSYLLELKVQQYKKLKEELIRHGLKLSWQQMETIIKRNFIIKNWMRNKKTSQPYK